MKKALSVALAAFAALFLLPFVAAADEPEAMELDFSQIPSSFGRDNLRWCSSAPFAEGAVFITINLADGTSHVTRNLPPATTLLCERGFFGGNDVSGITNDVREIASIEVETLSSVSEDGAFVHTWDCSAVIDEWLSFDQKQFHCTKGSEKAREATLVADVRLCIPLANGGCGRKYRLHTAVDLIWFHGWFHRYSAVEGVYRSWMVPSFKPDATEENRVRIGGEDFPMNCFAKADSRYEEYACFAW